MLEIISEGFILGLATGSVCAVVCTPLLAPALLVRDRPSWGGSVRRVSEFLAGRLIAYVGVGALFGALGAATALDKSSHLSSAANVPLGLAMILVALSGQGESGGFCRFAHRIGQHARLPLALGFLTGISPCPPFVKAVHGAVVQGGMVQGALLFLAFFVATSLFILPVIVVGMGALVKPLRALGHVAAGLAGLVFLTAGVRGLAPTRIDIAHVEVETDTLKEMLPEATRFSEKAGNPPFYYEAWRSQDGGEQRIGYVAVTTDAAPGIRGYGGPIPVLVAVDPKGVIRKISVLENQETPSFVIDVVSPRFTDRLVGKSHQDPIRLGADVDGITGATISAAAVVDGVRAAVRKLAAQALHESAAEVEASSWSAWMHPAPWLALVFVLTAAIGRRMRLRWMRYAVMTASIFVLGFWFKAFFSVRFVVDIATQNLPGLTMATWYAIVVPAWVLALVFGRVYCGWVCPFGALSELLGRLTGTPVKPDAGLDRRLRWIKYGVLLAIPIAFVAVQDNAVLAFEPFADVFTGTLGGTSLVRVAWLLLLLLGSLLVFRFFCRYFCPAGAAMAFVSRFRLIGRRKPKGCFECAECPIRCPMAAGNEPAAEDAECMGTLHCATCPRSKPDRPKRADEEPET